MEESEFEVEDYSVEEDSGSDFEEVVLNKKPSSKATKNGGKRTNQAKKGGGSDGLEDLVSDSESTLVRKKAKAGTESEGTKKKAAPKTKKPPGSKGKAKKKPSSDDEGSPDEDAPRVHDPIPTLNTNKTIEETYKKKSQLEHILLRPDTYIGSIERDAQKLWVFNTELEKLEERVVNIVPGLFKIFDEILVNAADNKIRDPSMNKIKVTIDKENNCISVYNNGKGIPILIHKEAKVYVPELIFGNLLTSSNFDDDEKKVVGGRNGFGAKLTNIFSSEFIVETADKGAGKKYYQRFSNNMGNKENPIITPYPKGEEFTKITFKPDLKKFNMTELDDDIVGLLTRRVYDMCATCDGVSVFLNDVKLPLKNFKDYIGLYLKSAETEDEPYMEKDLVYEKISDRWEIAVYPTDSGTFQQISFVNSISTSKGGTHVNYVTDKLVKIISDNVSTADKKKRESKASNSKKPVKKDDKKDVKKAKELTIRPADIKSHCWVFIKCLIDNPSFDSQTKENMTLKSSNFGTAFEFSSSYHKKMAQSRIVDMIHTFIDTKNKNLLKRALGSSRNASLRDILKLDDANHAGTAKSKFCTLILTEGDSAKALAIAGRSALSDEERNYFGVFPLRGKLLNVREASNKQIAENVEIKNICRILGLNSTTEYTDTKSLRYGHLMIMTDQDHDGSHIKGLLINYLDHLYPSLLKIDNFLQEFITPIIKVYPVSKTNTKSKHEFFTIPEYEEWRERNPNDKGRVKYFKGLATSTKEDARVYFKNIDKHKKVFSTIDDEGKNSIDLAFSKKRANDRKNWLAEFRLGTFLDSREQQISYPDFINKELIQFSMADNIRSIPNLLDGLKPGQRKIIFGCFKRNLVESLKVSQLVGYIAEKTAYHHGETSLESTIVGLAQDFVGSNNINLLFPDGMFGTRAKGGKDAGASRYISTKLCDITKAIFHPDDFPSLKQNVDEGLLVEPEFYVPVIPLLLVNGAEGIGTGWSTNIPSYNPKDIIENLRRRMKDEDMLPMTPWYRGFKGTIEPNGETRFKVSGTVAIADESHVDITELPVKVWTENYKEQLTGFIMAKEDKITEAHFIRDYKEHNTDISVHFRVIVNEDAMRMLESTDLATKFKLINTINTTNMTCFNEHGRIKQYVSPLDIMEEFYAVRLQYYYKRKQYLIEKYGAEVEELKFKVKFILAVIEGKLVVQNRKKLDIITQLIDQNFWTFSGKASNGVLCFNENPTIESAIADNGFDYLLSMPIWSLTLERVEDLKKKHNTKQAELEVILSKSAQQFWEDDLVVIEKHWQDLLDLDEKLQKEISTSKSIGKKRTKGKKLNSGSDSDEDYKVSKPKKPRVKKEPTSVKKESALSRNNSASVKQEKPNIPANKPASSTQNRQSSSATPEAHPTSIKEYFKPKPKPSVVNLSDSDDDIFKSVSERTKIPSLPRTGSAAKTFKKPPATKPKKIELSDDESDASLKSNKKVAPSKASAKPVKKPTKKVESSDEEVEEIISRPSTPIATSRPRRQAVSKVATYALNHGSDESDEDIDSQDASSNSDLEVSGSE